MPNSAPALPPQNQEPATSLMQVVSFNAPKRYQLTAEQLADYTKSLQVVSDNRFEDTAWNIVLPASGQSFLLSFPHSLLTEDGQILRIAVLERLHEYASEQSTKRLLNDAKIIFRFLYSKKLYIENTRTATIQVFAEYLDSISENPAQKNSLLRTFESLFAVCAENGFTDTVRAVSFTFRYPTESEPKRAPDKCVSDAVTRIIFDTSYPVPLAIRCALMLLRLIPNRINEVCTMDLECISYPDEGCFAVAISTSKETMHHIPERNLYRFQLDGYIESMLYVAIRKQQTAIRSCGEEIDALNLGYLFYCPDKRSLLSAKDVNDYLKKVIADNHIMDSKGEPGQMTTHDFRHIAIGERLRNDCISPVLTAIEANHSSVEQTLSYGYQSRHDEACHLAAIMDVVNKSSWGVPAPDNTTAASQELVKIKYERLEAQPFTRLIPGFGICTNQGCVPQFEKCVVCNLFDPNPVYLDYFLAAQVRLNKKISALREKRGSKEAIEFNERQLNTVNTFIARVDPSIEAEERRA